MHLARQALLKADAMSTTVTWIAPDQGFSKLGKFSVAYRSLFGESPSATSRRRPQDDQLAPKILPFGLLSAVSAYSACFASTLFASNLGGAVVHMARKNMLKGFVALIGLGAVVVLAPVQAPAQTSQQGAPAASNANAIPNRATERSGTHRTRAQYRNTFNRQKARATAEHARQLGVAPK
jgi:hypothetical protein